MTSGASRYQSLLQAIELHGWVVLADFISPELVAAMREELLQLDEQDQLNRAAIGRELGEHVNNRIRGDYISWFDEKQLSPTQRLYFEEMQQLQDVLNQHFFLGLIESEFMYAAYPAGNFYARHIDQHADNDARVMTVITYLNPSWDESKGGLLRIYLKDGSSADVVPHAATTVCFLSDEFEHEVLPASETRYSVTGWMRRRVLDTPA